MSGRKSQQTGLGSKCEVGSSDAAQGVVYQAESSSGTFAWIGWDMRTVTWDDTLVPLTPNVHRWSSCFRKLIFTRHGTRTLWGSQHEFISHTRQERGSGGLW